MVENATISPDSQTAKMPLPPKKAAKSKLTIPLGYWQRYLDFLKYGTFKKHWNFANALLNWALGRTTITTLPAFLKIEITRECKVGCKFCVVEKPSWYYSYDNYTRLIDKFKDYIYLVSLYDIGEPLESKDVIRCIQYAKERKVGSIISSSLAVEKEEQFWEDLVTSGLDKLIVAIDGITAPVYNKYRTNADFNLVMANLEKILYYKRKHKSNLFVEWQMIEFVWNLHEHEGGKQRAYKMGCNNFRIIKDVSKRLTYKKQRFVRSKNCLLPYIILIVTADNQVRPCYKIYDVPVEIGSLNKNTFEEIWNGSEVQRIRDKTQISCRPGCMTCQE